MDDLRDLHEQVVTLIRAAVLRERDACAKVAEARAATCTPPLVALGVLGEIAAAIRARV